MGLQMSRARLLWCIALAVARFKEIRAGEGSRFAKEVGAMSLMHEAIIAEKWGLRLTVDQMAETLGIARNTIYNQIAAGKFKVPTYVDGGKRYADYRDLAAYLDQHRASASSQV